MTQNNHAIYSITDNFGQPHRLENSEEYYQELDKKMIQLGKKIAKKNGWKTFKIGREWPLTQLIYLFDERYFI